MKRKLFLVLIIFTAVVSVGGWLILEATAPNMIERPHFVAIPIFLGVYQAIAIGFIDRYITADPRDAAQYMILSKVLKVLCSVAFILFNYWLLGLNTPFLIAFILFYLAFIILDSWTFTYSNKVAKRKLGDNDEND